MIPEGTRGGIIQETFGGSQLSSEALTLAFFIGRFPDAPLEVGNLMVEMHVDNRDVNIVLKIVHLTSNYIGKTFNQ